MASGNWTARAGMFQLSEVPGSEKIEPVLFRQWSPVTELEWRHNLLFDQPADQAAGFANIGYMANMKRRCKSATSPARRRTSRRTASCARRSRRPQHRTANLEDLGFFLRASWRRRYETFDFTDIERSSRRASC